MTDSLELANPLLKNKIRRMEIKERGLNRMCGYLIQRYLQILISFNTLVASFDTEVAFVIFLSRI